MSQGTRGCDRRNNESKQATCNNSCGAKGGEDVSEMASSTLESLSRGQ